MDREGYRQSDGSVELSPRFLAALTRGGSGVGLLGRAWEETHRRAHEQWLRTQRHDELGNWQDAERSLLRPRARPVQTWAERALAQAQAAELQAEKRHSQELVANLQESQAKCAQLDAENESFQWRCQALEAELAAAMAELQEERAHSKRFEAALEEEDMRRQVKQCRAEPLALSPKDVRRVPVPRIEKLGTEHFCMSPGSEASSGKGSPSDDDFFSTPNKLPLSARSDYSVCDLYESGPEAEVKILRKVIQDLELQLHSEKRDG